jgi:predicted ATP-dependent Lon-type protease
MRAKRYCSDLLFKGSSSSVVKTNKSASQGYRSQFTTDEWIDLLLRTIGLEPSYFSRRQKLHYLVRLIPLAEANYNLVNLVLARPGRATATRNCRRTRSC